MKKSIFKIILPLVLCLLYLLVTVIDHFASPEMRMGFTSYFFPEAHLLLLHLFTMAVLLYYSRIPVGLNTGLLLGAAFLLGIGMWLTILHFSGAFFLTTYASLAILVLYIIRFVKKKTKRPMDTLKLFFVLFFVSLNGRWMPFIRSMQKSTLANISLMFLWTVLILLMLEGIKEKRTSTGEMRSSID